MNRRHKTVFNRVLGINRVVSERISGKCATGGTTVIAGCALALAGLPVGSWADSCVGASTSITTTVGKCILSAGESVSISATGSVAHTGSSAVVLMMQGQAM